MRRPWLLLALLLASPAARAAEGEVRPAPAGGVVTNQAISSEPAYPDPDLIDANQSCLDCHQDRADTLAFADGSALPLFTDENELFASVHGEKLVCTDCHRMAGELPHPAVSARSRREYTQSESARCRRCHFLNYARTREGVHAALRGGKSGSPPTCVDCHGSHGMQPPQRPRAGISRRCGACHREQFDAYAKSVHGRALLDEGNEDVPVCTDCHRAHDIADPRAEAFTERVPRMCGRCHADEERMKRYRLSTEVLSTYLADFHGATTPRGRANYPGPEREAPPVRDGRVVAVCTDCHGVHDIEKARGDGMARIRARLEKSCAKCHTGSDGVPLDFPDSWLPHYEASFARAPLMMAVKAFRWVFIPVVVAGLLLQILLHIFRIAANRW